MLIDCVSVVMIAKNAQDTISESLESLQDFHEVILYLNHSDDNTKLIASDYKNVKIIEGDFIGFGPTKNRAASYSSNDWILSLDSDEIPSRSLLEEIAVLNLKDKSCLYVLKRDNYFLGKKTISTDEIIRLYCRKYTSFDDAMVHENIQIPKNAKVIKLKHSLKHLNITDINQTLTKMIKYTDLGAEGKKTCFFIVVLSKALFAFVQTYFLRFYLINGWRGFVIAVSNANRRFYKYLKQYINCKKD